MEASVAVTQAIPSVLLPVPTSIGIDTVPTIPVVEVSYEANIYEVPGLASAEQDERDVDQRFEAILANMVVDVVAKGISDPTHAEA